jgi:hypothetical protein
MRPLIVKHHACSRPLTAFMEEAPDAHQPHSEGSVGQPEGMTRRLLAQEGDATLRQHGHGSRSSARPEDGSRHSAGG